MLISRIAASPNAASIIGFHEGSVGNRRGSLRHLWHKLQQNITDTIANKALLNEFECKVLDISESDWISSTVVIRKNGNAELNRKGSNEPFAIITLPQSTVVGHLGKSLIQISGHTQTFLINCSQPEFGAVTATLLIWSRIRTGGIKQKLWCPPAQELPDAENDLLRCEVKAHFTVYHPQYLQWSPFLARLKRNGIIQLSNSQSQTIYSLDIRKVLGSRIKLVHPSIVDSRMAILLFPDLGGPESVYLQFNDIDDFEDWVATLKSLSLQPVSTPLSRDPLLSVRFQRNVTVKIASCQRDEFANPKKNVVSSLNDTYVDICLNRWVFARTCLNSDANTANWGQSFELPGPETTQYGSVLLNQFEFKLKQRRSSQSRIGSDQDLTIGSHIISQIGNNADWQWCELKPSNLNINICVTQTEIPILDSSYYRKLYDWISDLNLEATSRLVATKVASLSKLFPIFNDIYRAQGRQIEWILSLASEEVRMMDSVSDTAFRETSLFTRAVESLLYQHGEEILQKTIGRFVRKLVAGTERSLELDPSRNHSSEEIETNLVTMTHFLRYLWSLILSESIPSVCKSVFIHMNLEFQEIGLAGDELRTVMTRAMASLIFLRFYVPALVNPQLYNLTNKTLEPKHRRTLVLIAKILQVFANGIKFGSKEMWLVPMNKFIEEQQGSLINWYAEICEGVDTSLSIRKVDDENVSLTVSERPPKELPVETFMGQQLTSPNLIDEWAAYSKLVKLIRECKSVSVDGRVNQDSLVEEFVKECEEIERKQEELIHSLESPDNFEESVAAAAPELFLNQETLLFGTEKEHLEQESTKAKRSSSFADNISRIGWIQKSASSNDEPDDTRQKPSSSVRKLTQMLRISKSSSSKKVPDVS